MVAVKLFLLFNILNYFHKAFLAWNGVSKKPLKWQKCFVTDVPYFENLLCFLFAARDKPSIKNTSGFRGFILGLAVRLSNSPIRCIYFPLCPFGRLGIRAAERGNGLILCGYFT
jgi:hypothetical protein